MDAQLASGLKDVHKLKFPVIIEPKLDGVRTLSIRDDKGITLMSRQGKKLDNFEELERCLLEQQPMNTVWDGEVVSEDFKMLTNRAKAKRGTATHVPVKFVVFDWLTLDEYNAGKSVNNQEYRSNQLKQFFQQKFNYAISAGLVEPIMSVIANTIDDFMRITTEHAVMRYEGSIVKDLQEPYRAKRNQNWKKVKAVLSADLGVVDMERLYDKVYYKQDGTQIMDSDYEGQDPKLSHKEIRERIYGVTAKTTTNVATDKMGALFLEGVFEGQTIKTKCGSGFTDEERKWFWDNKQEILSKVPRMIVEIQFQELTRADGHEHYSLRFPTFLRIREDKTGAEGA